MTWPLTLVLLIGSTGASAGDAPAPASVDGWLATRLEPLVGLYEDLHRHPELSFQEEKTSARLADALRQAGATVTTGVGRHGVVGVLTNGRGPTVLVRSDMDALPVTEQTGLPYSSRATAVDRDGETVGVMHACGHDVHMACLVGTARWLAEHRDRWAGTVVLIGQPAEEAIGGAKAMLADGLYTRFPRPDFALALHVTNDQPTGVVSYTSGPALAGSTSVDLTIRGRGGHGAAPHLTVDPIVLAAAVVLDLQTIVSRECDPLQPAVVTVGSIQGGTKHNIIPDEARLQLTLRAYSDEVRERLIDGIQRRIQGLAAAHGAPGPSFAIRESTPPTINTPALVERVLPALRTELGAERVVAVPAVMGAEDFGLYSQGGVPTFMFRLGTIDAAKLKAARESKQAPPSLHSATYAPDAPPSIRAGVRAMTASVVVLLPPS